MNNKKTTLTIIAVAVLLVSVFAGTYAFFTAAGSADASNDIKVATINGLTMTLKDAGQVGTAGTIDPLNLKFTTYFSIENEGQATQYVRILFKNLTNTYSEDLVYTLEEVNKIPTDETDAQTVTASKKYKDKVRVPANATGTPTNAELADTVEVRRATTTAPGNNTLVANTQYYRVTIEYLYSDTKDQTPDASAEFYTEFDMELGNAPIATTKFICINKDTNEKEDCGTIDTGTKIALGGQRFWVISHNTETKEIRALAEYNLYVGGIYNGSDTKASDVNTSDANYGLQDERAKGWISGANPDIKTATVAFSNSTSPEAYTTYNGSTINANSGYTNYKYSQLKDYIDAYVSKINGIYKTELTGDAITYSELVDLGCPSGRGTCATTYPWVKTTSYWSGSASGDVGVWSVRSSGTFDSTSCGYDHYLGVRPVINLSESSF